MLSVQDNSDRSSTASGSTAARAFIGGARWLVAALLVSCCYTHLNATESDVSKEYQIKAAFLYNFAKFVEWPPSAFPHADAPIVIGILGTSPFHGHLSRIVQGRRVNGRPIVVRAIDEGGDGSRVHLLFVPTGRETRPEFAHIVATRPDIVTVGESPAFAELDGMINFITDSDRIRFTVDLTATERTELRISAQLLKLASSVRRKR